MPTEKYLRSLKMDSENSLGIETFLTKYPARLRVWKLLESIPSMTCTEVSLRIGRSKPSVGKNITALRKDKLIYISGWIPGEKSDGDSAPRYSVRLSEQEDVPRPRPKTKAEIFKKYWAKTHRRYRPLRANTVTAWKNTMMSLISTRPTSVTQVRRKRSDM